MDAQAGLVILGDGSCKAGQASQHLDLSHVMAPSTHSGKGHSVPSARPWMRDLTCGWAWVLCMCTHPMCVLAHSFPPVHGNKQPISSFLTFLWVLKCYHPKHNIMPLFSYFNQEFKWHLDLYITYQQQNHTILTSLIIAISNQLFLK